MKDTSNAKLLEDFSVYDRQLVGDHNWIFRENVGLLAGGGFTQKNVLSDFASNVNDFPNRAKLGADAL